MTAPPAPIVNRLNAPFWEGAKAGRLMLPFCVRTGRAFWPPSPLSPFCIESEVAWREASPHGGLESLVVQRRSFHPAFAPLTPFGVGLVALAAGPRLLAHVAAPDAPGAPSPGDPVQLSFRPLSANGPPVLVAERAPTSNPDHSPE